MECSICLELIKTDSYVATDSTDDKIDEKDPSCIRLKCGHAYHATCTMESFRCGKNCPMCREKSIPEIEEEFDEGFEILVENSETERLIKDMELEVEHLRKTDSSVKKSREVLNKSIKKYRVYCEEIKKERKLQIKNALKVLRNKKKSKFEKLIKNVEKNLMDVKDAETKALSNKRTQLDLDTYNFHPWITSDFSARKNILISNDYTSTDPLLKKFWN